MRLLLPLITTTIASLLFLAQTATAAPADYSISLQSSKNGDGITKLAFGSCHKTKYANANIWKTIASHNPGAFLWTGDSIYAPTKQGSLPDLNREYDKMKDDDSVGYHLHMKDIPTFGTWDDHDYGQNDAGKYLTERLERRKLFWDFMQHHNDNDKNKLVLNESRSGVYHSIDMKMVGGKNDDSRNNIVRVISLDTRWNRDSHCIPSIASSGIPLGAALSCLTRWFLAGIAGSSLHRRLCGDNGRTTILGEEQWTWLEQQLSSSSEAQVHVIISSIQVLSTNPAMEGWGHYPHEQQRLLDLLNRHRPSGVVILSGDVHHAELIQSPDSTSPFFEVTSSGLTHSCAGAKIYGFLCEPLLNSFTAHRAWRTAYYTKRNFGTIEIDWNASKMRVNVESLEDNDENDAVVLSTDWKPWHFSSLVGNVPQVMDGHLLYKFKLLFLGLLLTLVISLHLFIGYMVYQSSQQYKPLKRKRKQE